MAVKALIPSFVKGYMHMHTVRLLITDTRVPSLLMMYENNLILKSENSRKGGAQRNNHFHVEMTRNMLSNVD